MKIINLLVLSFSLCAVTSSVYGQKTVTGRVLDEKFDEVIGCSLYVNDTLRIGYTDLNGYFEVELDILWKVMTLYATGYEEVAVEITERCSDIEIILMSARWSHGLSNRRVDKLRRDRFNQLFSLHLEAINKGFFKELPCYRRRFELIKPRLDEIKDEIKDNIMACIMII